MNGKQVYGGSTFKKNFTEPFDSMKVAGYTAPHWNVEPATVAKIWDDAGTVSALFGTAIHHMRETLSGGDTWDYYQEMIDCMRLCEKLYEENKEIGAHISKVMKKPDVRENYALSKHKDIRRLMYKTDEELREFMDQVEREFQEIDQFKGHETLPELYVTHSKLNMGGEIDRLVILDGPSKKCEIWDYKIQHSLAVESSKNKLINELAMKKPNKIVPVKIQESYYAFCLHKAGWDVVGGGVYGYEDGWKIWRLDLIPMDKMEKLLEKYLSDD